MQSSRRRGRAQRLRTVANARHAEALGLERIWVAEHHGMPAVASSATDLLVGQMAAAPSTIRVGSGGVMLGNHAPLLLAERFATLEAFAPGRIDMGLGRAPGTDPRTAWALRRDHHAVQGQAFLDEVRELLALFDGDLPDGHVLAGLRAVWDAEAHHRGLSLMVEAMSLGRRAAA